MTNAPDKFMEMAFEIEALKAELADMTERKNSAYNERNCVVAALAHIYPSGIRKTAIEGWDDEWHNCVFIDTPVGQLSWHYHDTEVAAFADLLAYTKEWDGHTTAQKYERLAQLRRELHPDFSNGRMWTVMMHVAHERGMQDGQWGGAEHDDTHDAKDWRRFIDKQMLLMHTNGGERERFIKIAALAVAAVESIDRKARDVHA